jgi:membrane protein DedA with SNARE-associated domain
MILDILIIAGLCVVIGGASIPLSFSVNSSPTVVWIGNALGSLLSAVLVIYIGNKITNKKFEKKLSKKYVGRKVVTIFEEGEDNKKVKKASLMINKHGLKLFAFICPIFPGVLVSTAAVYILDLDLPTFKRWVYTGIFFASGLYVFGYWWVFVRA